MQSFNIHRVKTKQFGFEIIENLPVEFSEDSIQALKNLGVRIPGSTWICQVFLYKDYLQHKDEVHELIREKTHIDIDEPRTSAIGNVEVNFHCFAWDYNHDFHEDFLNRTRDEQKSEVEFDMKAVVKSLTEFFKDK